MRVFRLGDEHGFYKGLHARNKCVWVALFQFEATKSSLIRKSSRVTVDLSCQNRYCLPTIPSAEATRSCPTFLVPPSRTLLPLPRVSWVFAISFSSTSSRASACVGLRPPRATAPRLSSSGLALGFFSTFHSLFPSSSFRPGIPRKVASTFGPEKPSVRAPVFCPLGCGPPQHSRRAAPFRYHHCALLYARHVLRASRSPQFRIIESRWPCPGHCPHFHSPENLWHQRICSHLHRLQQYWRRRRLFGRRRASPLCGRP